MTPNDADLTLTVLGGMALDRRFPVPGPVLQPGKALALVVYLHCTPGHVADRDQLVDLLWSDSDPTSGRHALSQLVYHIRQTLGREALRIDGTGIRLTLPLASDYAAFRAAIEARDFATARSVYRGKFLPVFAASGAANFEHWADRERLVLQDDFAHATEFLARRALEVGHSREAIRLALEARDAAPDREPLWRLVIETAVAAGDKVLGNREGARFHRDREERGRPLEPASERLLATLDEEWRDSNESLHGPKADLIAREAEFGEILRAWSQAREGRGSHLHFQAPAGFGKTRLVNDAALRLHSLGARVVTLKAFPGERRMPYSFVGDLAAALAELPGARSVSPGSVPHLVDLAPQLASTFGSLGGQKPGTGNAPRLRLRAITDLAHGVASQAPLALFLDDLHWLDDDSYTVVVGLIRRASTASMLVVTTGRLGAARDLPSIADSCFQLRPLDPAETAALLRSMGSCSSPQWFDATGSALCEAAGGSPLIISQIIRLAMEVGTLSWEQGAWTPRAPFDGQAAMSFARDVRDRVLRDLNGHQRAVLAVLAAAGTPLTANQMEAIDPDRPNSEALAHLEQAGLAEREGAGWSIAHAEVSEAVFAAATPGERKAAEARLAQFFSRPNASLAELRRAIRHWDRAGDPASHRVAFRTLVRLMRASGDRRPVSHLAVEVAGSSSPATAQALARTVPWFERHPGINRLGVAVAAAATVIAARLSVASTTEHLEILLVAHSASAKLTEGGYSVPIRAEVGSDPIFVATGRHEPRLRTIPRPAHQLTWSPDGHAAVWTQDGNDGNTQDIYGSLNGGPPTLIAGGPGDDTQPAWTDQGRTLVFVTARWSPPGGHRYDLATTSPGSSLVRRITDGTQSATDPHPSPDGHSVAFLGRPTGKGVAVFCWAPLAPIAPPHCKAPPEGQASRVFGWANDGTILVRTDFVGRQVLQRLNPGTGLLTSIHPNVGAASVSPDGRWMAFEAARRETGPGLWYVAPTAEPGATRRLVLPADWSGAAISWRIAGRNPLRATALAGLDTIPATAGFGYQLQRPDEWGQTTAVSNHTRWSVDDTTVATVDSSGFVTPHRPGVVTLIASDDSAGLMTKRVAVVPSRWHMAMREAWRAGALDREWRIYGQPRPVQVTDATGRGAFWNRGDGVYPSGAYLLRTRSADHGLGIRAKIRINVTRLHWQQLTIDFRGDVDPAALDAWDHRTGAPPTSPQACGFEYPWSEGPGSPDAMGLFAGNEPWTTTAPPDLKTGKEHEITVQLFPDGTCGLAFDGRPIARSRGGLSMTSPFRVWLGGASYRTQALVGEVDLWEGVRPDIDWTALPRNRPRATDSEKDE